MVGKWQRKERTVACRRTCQWQSSGWSTEFRQLSFRLSDSIPIVEKVLAQNIDFVHKSLVFHRSQMLSDSNEAFLKINHMFELLFATMEGFYADVPCCIKNAAELSKDEEDETEALLEKVAEFSQAEEDETDEEMVTTGELEKKEADLKLRLRLLKFRKQKKLLKLELTHVSEVSRKIKHTQDLLRFNQSQLDELDTQRTAIEKLNREKDGKLKEVKEKTALMERTRTKTIEERRGLATEKKQLDADKEALRKATRAAENKDVELQELRDEVALKQARIQDCERTLASLRTTFKLMGMTKLNKLKAAAVQPFKRKLKL